MLSILTKLRPLCCGLLLFQRYPVVMSTYLGIMGRVLLQNTRFFSLLLSQMACELGQEVRILSCYFSWIAFGSPAFFWPERPFPCCSVLVDPQSTLERDSFPFFWFSFWLSCSKDLHVPELAYSISLSFIWPLNFFRAAAHNRPVAYIGTCVGTSRVCCLGGSCTRNNHLIPHWVSGESGSLCARFTDEDTKILLLEAIPLCL